MIHDSNNENMKKKLIEHMEMYLGEIQDGWTGASSDHESAFQVARFKNGAIDGHCFSTIGLSNHVVHSVKSGKKFRCELMMMAHDGVNVLPAILDQVAHEMLDSGVVLLRGDVIGPRGRIFERSDMSCLYVTNPVYLPDEFCICEVPELGPVLFIWLVPITEAEGNFVRASGWEAFEDLLQDDDPDLLDIYRSSCKSIV